MDDQESIERLIEEIEYIRSMVGEHYSAKEYGAAVIGAYPRLRDEIRQLRRTPREIGIAAADSADRAVADELRLQTKVAHELRHENDQNAKLLARQDQELERLRSVVQDEVNLRRKIVNQVRSDPRATNDDIIGITIRDYENRADLLERALKEQE